ncbi:MAG: hypothetical protein QG608_1505 [Actinomycetota bacterium]|nr:hypothetical protein [Actinomycetota bacterium]
MRLQESTTTVPVPARSVPGTDSGPYPVLYQMNARVRMTQLSRCLGRPATLDDIPDPELDALAGAGYTWLYLLGVWQTGETGRRISRTSPGWRSEFERTLPDLTDDDIPGSCFAVTWYTVHERLGGDAALERLRGRLNSRGMKLMLDFVPNHTAPDHPWVMENPDFYIAGSQEDRERTPQNWARCRTGAGERILAHGRDPYFDGWPDTLQLDYSNPVLRAARIEELRGIAQRCDGVRCDMAMLVLPDVFERTWGRDPGNFWEEALPAVRAQVPGFVFMAEVYWDREWQLQQLGFDYTYDKTLYDRLLTGDARTVRGHFLADPVYQARSARFLENHDEPRAASVFDWDQHRAAATLTFTCPGLRFVHQGQNIGREIRVSPHLDRAPEERVKEEVRRFYDRLLACAASEPLLTGCWQLLETLPAWEGNATHEDFVAFSWEGGTGERFLVAVNYSPHPAQCYVPVLFDRMEGHTFVLEDRLDGYRYERSGEDLTDHGLYLDVPPWRAHLFELRPLG